MLEFKPGCFVDKEDYVKHKNEISIYSKEFLYDLMQKYIYNGKSRDSLGPGSKEHRKVLEDVCEFLDIDTIGSKLDLARKISDYAFILNRWDQSCYSNGDTITKEGYIRICISLWCHKFAEISTLAYSQNLLGENEESFNNHEQSKNNYTIKPGIDIYQTFQNFEYTYAKALSEFIDNSIASYENDILKPGDELKNTQPLNILIRFHAYDVNSQTVAISDDGAGIDQNDLDRVLKAGDRKYNSGLNVYGLGMKFAAGWWCQKYTIHSKHESTVRSFIANIDFTKESVPVSHPIHGYFKGERSKHLVFARDTGTIISLLAKQNVGDSPGNKYRFVTLDDYYNIKSELEEIYQSYLQPGGYLSPSGNKIVVNMTMMYELTSKGSNSTDKLKHIKDNILVSQFWESSGVEPIKSSKSENWVEKYTLSYTAQNGSTYEIDCLLFMLPTQIRDYSTIKYMYRGKSIKHYTFINYNPNKILARTQYSGSPHNPTSMVGQKAQRVSSYTRGYIDFTNVGKSLDGKNIDLNESDLKEIERLFGLLFKKSRLYTMMRNYNTKKKIASPKKPISIPPIPIPPDTVTISKINSAPATPIVIKKQLSLPELITAGSYTYDCGEISLYLRVDLTQHDVFDYGGKNDYTYSFSVNTSIVSHTLIRNFILLLVLFLNYSSDSFSKAKLNDMWDTYSGLASEND